MSEVAPRLIPGRPLAERADQPQFVERRRAQPVDQASDIRYCGPQLGPQLGGLLLGGRRITLNGHAQGPSLDRQGGELGAEAVMEITAQAPALLFTGGDDPLARALEIGGEAHRMGGDADLARQVFQETPVSGAKCLAGTARSDDQFADRLGLIDERHPDDPGTDIPAAAAGSGAFAAVEDDSGVGQPQCLGHRPHDRGQDLLRGEGAFQSLAEASKDGVGIVAVAIEEAIHCPLHPLSQRLERNGDDAGGEERQNHPPSVWNNAPTPVTTKMYSPATSAVSTV